MPIELEFTPLSEVPAILAELNESYLSGKLAPLEWRKEQLRNLWRLLDVRESSSRNITLLTSERKTRML